MRQINKNALSGALKVRLLPNSLSQTTRFTLDDDPCIPPDAGDFFAFALIFILADVPSVLFPPSLLPLTITPVPAQRLTLPSSHRL
jgi:hypothetical protein